MSLRIENTLNLGEIRRRVEEVTPDAVQAAADHVLTVAKEKAPLLVDLPRANDERRANPGELRDSGYTRVVDDSTVEVGFTAYWAAWQHERMDYHHEVGQAKYLEMPLVEEKEEALRIMADKVRQVLHG